MSEIDAAVVDFLLSDELEEETTAEENYKLALQSILRWTIRRDRLSDAEIVLAIKKVAKTALGKS